MRLLALTLAALAACSDAPAGGDGAASIELGPDAGHDAQPAPDAEPATCSTASLGAGVQCTDTLPAGGASYRVALAPDAYLAVQATATGELVLAARYGSADAEEMARTEGQAPRLALYNPTAATLDAWLEVAPAKTTAADQPLTLALEGAAFAPKTPCAADCATILQLPAPVPAAAYRLVSPPRYQLGRRELVQALVAAAAEVTAAGPVGLGDLSQADGKIPGTDVSQPRHPAPSHQDGFSADVAYFRTGGDNLGTHPACSTPDYRFCSGPHDLDLSRNVAFMLALCREPRISQILVDPLMKADLLQQAAQAQSAGLADAEAVKKLQSVLMSGIPYHTDHFHIAVFRQCNDGLDNDGDGKIDLADSGCSDALDDSE